MKMSVLRLGHRLHRDERVTTHCGLVARAFGADEMIISGSKDTGIEDSIKKVVKNWGGSFQINYEKDWKGVIKGWRGIVIHLTVYGMPIQNKIKEIRKLKKDVLIVIGGEKVPREVFELADYNISVTGQPHSEVAALTVFLDKIFNGNELKNKFKNARLVVSPSENGKIIIKNK